jgi:hypothetical protein
MDTECVSIKIEDIRITIYYSMPLTRLAKYILITGTINFTVCALFTYYCGGELRYICERALPWFMSGPIKVPCYAIALFIIAIIYYYLS